MKSLLLSISLILTTALSAQNINENYEKWTVKDEVINITGIDLSPDGKEVALVGGKMNAIYIYDYNQRKILREIPIARDYSGYNIQYSAKGNYLTLQERVVETSAKKSRKADFAIVDLNQEKVIHEFNKISDVKITPDEKQVITLENKKVTIRDLSSGNVLTDFKAEDATNALAVSPDGQQLAIVKKPSKKEVAMLVSRKMKKKAIKEAAKTKFLIAIYNKGTQELESIVPEFYDNISLLFYMQNGEKLLSFNLAQNPYVNVALPKEDYRPSREGYAGRSTTQPDFKYSEDGKYFGIATIEMHPTVNIYKVETNAIVDSYNTKMRIWKNAKNKIYAGTNTSFVFLPDNNYVLIAYGNSLIKWRINK